MTKAKREQLINLWNGCFDAETAAQMVGVSQKATAKLFAKLEASSE